jgi:hypothetical protein
MVRFEKNTRSKSINPVASQCEAGSLCEPVRLLLGETIEEWCQSRVADFALGEVDTGDGGL